MKKKDYQSPTIRVVCYGQLLLRSGSGVWSERGLDYGGIDEEGEQDPAARRRYHDVWQDDEEDWD